MNSDLVRSDGFESSFRNYGVQSFSGGLESKQGRYDEETVVVDPGSDAFLNPGFGMEKSGFGINRPDYISESCAFFYLWIRDPG